LRIQLLKKNFARQPSGAARRKVERRPRKPFRMCARLKAVNQPAIDERGNDRA
jgi:hypothetical protein